MRMVKLNAKAVQQVLNTETRKPKAQWRVMTRGMIVLNARGAHFRTKLVKMFAKHVEKIFKFTSNEKGLKRGLKCCKFKVLNF